MEPADNKWIVLYNRNGLTHAVEVTVEDNRESGRAGRIVEAARKTAAIWTAVEIEPLAYFRSGHVNAGATLQILSQEIEWKAELGRVRL